MMTLAQQVSWLTYRKELRETIGEEQLSLLDANMAKTFLQSTLDNGIPLSSVVSERVSCHEGLEARLTQLEARKHIDWSKPHDAPPCFKVNDATLTMLHRSLSAVEWMWCDVP